MAKPTYFANLIAGQQHVYDSNLTVIRAGFAAMKPDSRRDPAKRETRREFYRQLVEAHRRNRKLFDHFRF